MYDHTSVLATIEHIFGLLPLTERDKHANTLNHLFSLASPRTDAPPDPSTQGFLHVAFLRDMQTSPPAEREQRTAKYLSITTRGEAKHYLAEVRQKVEPQRGSHYKPGSAV